MKILQVCNKVPYPPRDGGSVAMFNLARGLAVGGNQVDIISMETYKHKDTEQGKPLPENITHHSIPVETHIKIIELVKNLLFSRMPYNAVRFIDEGFRGHLIEMLEAKKYDIVQLEGLYLSPYIKTIRKHSL